MWKLFINFYYLHYFYLIFYLFNFLFQLIQKSYNGAKFRGHDHFKTSLLKIQQKQKTFNTEFLQIFSFLNNVQNAKLIISEYVN